MEINLRHIFNFRGVERARARAYDRRGREREREKERDSEVERKKVVVVVVVVVVCEGGKGMCVWKVRTWASRRARCFGRRLANLILSCTVSLYLPWGKRNKRNKQRWWCSGQFLGTARLAHARPRMAKLVHAVLQCVLLGASRTGAGRLVHDHAGSRTDAPCTQCVPKWQSN